MQKILLIGEDSPLLSTRAAIIQKTGADVTCCNSSKFADSLGTGDFSLVVVCHSLSNDADCTVVRESHLRWPEARVLRIQAVDNHRVVTCNCHVDGMTLGGEPGKLLDEVRNLLIKAA